MFVDVGDQQSIADDLSTFQSHLTHVAAMLEGADRRSLCLLDEAGTGTDPAEGGALAEATLRRLAARGARVVVTTHIGALKAFAQDTPGVANGSMAFDREALAPTYRFRPGVPGSSYAFEIARRVGLPPPVVQDARDRVGDATVRLDALISDVEKRAPSSPRADLRAATARLSEAEARLAEADRVKADYEQRLERLRADTDRRRAEALAEADEILSGANAAVERAVREIREAQADADATQAARDALDEARAVVAKRTGAVKKRQTRRRAAAPAAPAVAGPIEPGDHVRVSDTGAPRGEGPVGEVMEITDREAVVAFGQLVSRVKLGRLVKVGGPVSRGRVSPPKTPRGASAPALHVQTRLDLRGARVDEALADVQQFVDAGLVAGVSQLEILHGKGTGALRQAIHEALARRRDVAAFGVAPVEQGGDGVTLVSF